MIANKDGFVQFINQLPVTDSTKAIYRNWVRRIDENLPKTLSPQTVQSERDVTRLSGMMPKGTFTPGHIKDVRCIIRYYLKYCLDDGVAIQQEIADARGDFSPSSLIEAREFVQRSIALRRGQRKFRSQLMIAYNGRCCVTGTPAQDVLEAAHIKPYAQNGSNSVSNGLLLRSDIHVLFDLRLLSVDPKNGKIYCTKQLRKTAPYDRLHGSKVFLPLDPRFCPDSDLLQEHFDETKD